MKEYETIEVTEKTISQCSQEMRNANGVNKDSTKRF
jgi:hypothetical protein